MFRIGIPRPSLVLVFLLALGGCNWLPADYSAEPEPEPAPKGTALPPPLEPSDAGVLPESEESSPQLVIRGPDGKIWTRDPEAGGAYDADVEACYNYARAQIEHDRMIESDASSAFGRGAGDSGLSDLTRQMNQFEQSNRWPALFQRCMESRGYARN